MTEPRRRAPGMDPEQRREMILQSALPLVAEYGAAVTTAQIARAAGIGEATVFRVFTDKDELLKAVIVRTLDPAHVLRELGSIPLDQPLDARLVDAAEALRAHFGRIGSVVGALHATGHHRRRPQPEEARDAGLDRNASQEATKAAVAELFEPEAERLRLPVAAAAQMFLGFMFARARHHEEEIDAADLVDVFLHGALRPDGS